LSRENVELVRRHLEPYDGQDFGPILSELVDRFGPAPEPDAVLWGRHDVNFGEFIAWRLAEDIPGTRALRWMEDSGHLLMLEEPDVYADAVARLAVGVGSTDEDAEEQPRLPSAAARSDTRRAETPRSDGDQ
jgi:hypothetical protein